MLTADELQHLAELGGGTFRAYVVDHELIFDMQDPEAEVSGVRIDAHGLRLRCYLYFSFHPTHRIITPYRYCLTDIEFFAAGRSSGMAHTGMAEAVALFRMTPKQVIARYKPVIFRLIMGLDRQEPQPEE